MCPRPDTHIVCPLTCLPALPALPACPPALQDVTGGCERILRTPVPLS